LTRIIIAALAAGMWWSGHAVAHADPNDGAFLDAVHNANGLPGDDALLIAFAHQYCAGGHTDAGVQLGLQGFPYEGLYPLRVISARYYCPERVVQPPQQLPSPVLVPPGLYPR
jgi:hypothetical protein